MREVENLPFGPTARWTSLNLVGSFDRPPGCRTWLGAPVVVSHWQGDRRPLRADKNKTL